MLLMSKGSYLLVRILPQIFNIHLLGLLPQIVFMSYNSLWGFKNSYKNDFGIGQMANHSTPTTYLYYPPVEIDG